jgi:hypothetical protein
MRGRARNSKLVHAVITLSKITALIVCCFVLTKDSEAKPSPETDFVVADVESGLFVAIQSEHSAPFLLSDWLSDNGSGGFPQDFSDEHRRIDEWESSPDQ